jgi:hypothetical protein
LNSSTSKLLPQVKCFNRTGAESTSFDKRIDYFLLTIETKP